MAHRLAMVNGCPMNSTDSASVCVNDLTRPTSRRRLAVLCLAALAAGIGVATWLEVRGAVSYAGQLQARTTTVTAGRAARIALMIVTPGQRVVPGEKLLELIDDRQSGQITAKKRELLELEADLQRVKATADVDLDWRRRELQGEMFQTQFKANSISQEKLSKQVEQLAWQEHLTSRIKDLQAGPPLARRPPLCSRERSRGGAGRPRIPAAARGNLFNIPPDLIQRHTPRLLEGARLVCEALETARNHQ